ncbi:hypothetical protein [Roseiconus lacunae]|uniref:hypothetical protein n=1 Tax=Roseiconus lacunae TaxID=2605694 RepID=UPI0011F25C61|nr:hypothetical protein [Roseiconus lacunae]
MTLAFAIDGPAKNTQIRLDEMHTRVFVADPDDLRFAIEHEARPLPVAETFYHRRQFAFAQFDCPTYRIDVSATIATVDPTLKLKRLPKGAPLQVHRTEKPVPNIATDFDAWWRFTCFRLGIQNDRDTAIELQREAEFLEALRREQRRVLSRLKGK